MLSSVGDSVKGVVVLQLGGDEVLVVEDPLPHLAQSRINEGNCGEPEPNSQHDVVAVHQTSGATPQHLLWDAAVNQRVGERLREDQVENDVRHHGQEEAPPDPRVRTEIEEQVRRGALHLRPNGGELLVQVVQDNVRLHKSPDHLRQDEAKAPAVRHREHDRHLKDGTRL
mmetsp:Transcript_11817/g.32351  ORF Transcript_11817/g.32351 Transcript_11817/m.32351 type:complete len:170 (-) Transcript_11817:278-787(-)